jgi:hypothetical protein
MDIALFFQFSFIWYCFMNHKYEALHRLKKYMLYILCSLILFNPFNLIVDSRLILTQNEL